MTQGLISRTADHHTGCLFTVHAFHNICMYKYRVSYSNLLYLSHRNCNIFELHEDYKSIHPQMDALGSLVTESQPYVGEEGGAEHM